MTMIESVSAIRASRLRVAGDGGVEVLHLLELGRAGDGVVDQRPQRADEVVAPQRLLVLLLLVVALPLS